MDERVLQRMMAPLAHRGPDGARAVIHGNLAFAAQHLWVTPESAGEQQPLEHPDALLVMDGRLDNRDELIAALQQPRPSTDAALALAAFRRWKGDFPRHLNGDFALAVFDRAERQVIVARDALGVRPLYFHHRPGLFAFASEIKALLAHPAVSAEPDDGGLAHVLMVSAPTLEGADRTCFASIRSVSPGRTVVASERSLSVTTHWDFDLSRPAEPRSFEEYAEELRELFARAVRRRTRSIHPVGVLVSGGLDSSSVFCHARAVAEAAPAWFPALVGVSHTADDGSAADERAFLAELERLPGARIVRVPLAQHQGVVAGAAEQIRHVEVPLLDYLWSVTSAMYQAARDRGARVLLSGHWGDQVMFCSSYLADLFLRLQWDELRRHVREYASWLEPGAPAVHLRRAMVEAARRALPAWLHRPLKHLRRRLGGTRTPPWYGPRLTKWAGQDGALSAIPAHSAQARQLYLAARSPYHTRCLEWDNKAAAMHGLEFAFPFLDRDVVSFLIATPGSIHNQGGVPRALFREAMRGTLPEPIRRRSWKADFTDQVNVGVTRDFESIARSLARADGAAKGYFLPGVLPNRVEALRGRLQGPACRDSWDLTDAFGLETWLRVFFEDPRSKETTRAKETEAPGPPEEAVSAAPAGPAR